MFKGICFHKAIIFQAAYFKFTPFVEQQFIKQKKSVGNKWRQDETNFI